MATDSIFFTCRAKSILIFFSRTHLISVFLDQNWEFLCKIVPVWCFNQSINKIMMLLREFLNHCFFSKESFSIILTCVVESCLCNLFWSLCIRLWPLALKWFYSFCQILHVRSFRIVYLKHWKKAILITTDIYPIYPISWLHVIASPLYNFPPF